MLKDAEADFEDRKKTKTGNTNSRSWKRQYDRELGYMPEMHLTCDEFTII